MSKETIDSIIAFGAGDLFTTWMVIMLKVVHDTVPLPEQMLMSAVLGFVGGFFGLAGKYLFTAISESLKKKCHGKHSGEQQ